MPARRRCRPATGGGSSSSAPASPAWCWPGNCARQATAPLILEARTRAGGRNWSLRRGDEIRETDSVQRIAWDAGPHMYFNPGPARLPYHHEGILSYCRELGVPLEVMSNDNRGALLQIRRGVRRQAAAQPAGGQRHPRLRRGTGGQGDRPGRADPGGHHRGQGTHPRAAAQLRRARPGHGIQGLRPRRLQRAAGRRDRRRARAASRSICARSSMPTSGSSRAISARAGIRRRR